MKSHLTHPIAVPDLFSPNSLQIKKEIEQKIRGRDYLDLAFFGPRRFFLYEAPGGGGGAGSEISPK